jgi:tripartite-type tricarboxylate transporter receptor subunit TctC
MFTPTGTPPDIARKIGDDLRAVLRDPAFADRHATSKGLDLIASSGEHLAQVIRDEVPVVGEMIRAARIDPQ